MSRSALVLRMLVVGVAGSAPLGAWAARWVDLGSALNRLAFTAIGVGFFVVKFGAFALTIGLSSFCCRHSWTSKATVPERAFIGPRRCWWASRSRG